MYYFFKLVIYLVKNSPLNLPFKPIYPWHTSKLRNPRYLLTVTCHYPAAIVSTYQFSLWKTKGKLYLWQCILSMDIYHYFTKYFCFFQKRQSIVVSNSFVSSIIFWFNLWLFIACNIYSNKCKEILVPTI